MIRKVTREDTPYEICVLCGNLTNVKEVHARRIQKNYIYGVGQICEDCAEKLKENDDPNELKVVD